MWHRYRVELYPHIPGLGIGCGIFDKYGNELEFPSAFRQCLRNGKPRGIVKIGIANGTYSSGAQTVALRLNSPLTLVDSTNGVRYKLLLLAS